MRAGHARHLPIGRGTGVAVGITLALNGFGSSTWISRIPATRDRLDADPRTLGFMLLMTGIGALALMPTAGRLAARYGSRPVLIGSVFVAAPLLVLAALTPTPLTTGVAMFALGSGLGTADVVINVQGSFVDRTLDRDYMPRYHAGWSIGAIAGAGLGALASRLGWPLWEHFTVAAVILVVATCYFALRWYVDDREPTSDHHQAAKASSLLRDRRLLTIGLVVLAAVFLEGAAADCVGICDVRLGHGTGPHSGNTTDCKIWSGNSHSNCRSHRTRGRGHRSGNSECRNRTHRNPDVGNRNGIGLPSGYECLR